MKEERNIPFFLQSQFSPFLTAFTLELILYLGRALTQVILVIYIISTHFFVIDQVKLLHSFQWLLFLNSLLESSQFLMDFSAVFTIYIILCNKPFFLFLNTTYTHTHTHTHTHIYIYIYTFPGKTYFKMFWQVFNKYFLFECHI